MTGDDTEARDAGPIPRAGKHPPRTIEQWDYLPDDDAFPRFHLWFKSGLRKAGMPEW